VCVCVLAYRHRLRSSVCLGLRAGCARTNNDNNSNEDKPKFNMPQNDEVLSHDLPSDPVTSQIQTTTIQTSSSF
jgi:hypothetical protein